MTQEIRTYPLTWPHGWKRTHVKEHARFNRKERGANQNYSRSRDITIAEAVRYVLDELRKMGVNDWKVIISTNLQLRKDGLPYSQQKEPDDAGVAVWWQEGKGHRVIALDKYHRIADNIHAVGKTIEALRGIDRWGSGEILQRTFTGFTALPAPASDNWWEVLGVQSHTSSAEVTDAYKRVRFKAHPDQGGSAEEFHKVQEAYAAFKQERGIA